MITDRHTTLGKTSLDEGSARRRDLYLKTHNIHKRQTSIPTAGFEPAIPVSEKPQTFSLLNDFKDILRKKKTLNNLFLLAKLFNLFSSSRIL